MDATEMDEKTYTLNLTNEEIIKLDGKCREEVQKEVELAKNRIKSVKKFQDLNKPEAYFIAEIVDYASRAGKIDFSHKELSYCNICNEKKTYAKYTRNSKYHRKGDLNYKQPIYLRGVELKKIKSFNISIKGHAYIGCCISCFGKLKPYLAEALEDIKAEITDKITGKPPRFKCYDKKECTNCGWVGGEHQLRRLNALFGGTYAGGCPNCEAKNTLGKNPIETLNEFMVVPSKKESKK